MRLDNLDQPYGDGRDDHTVWIESARKPDVFQFVTKRQPPSGGFGGLIPEYRVVRRAPDGHIVQVFGIAADDPQDLVEAAQRIAKTWSGQVALDHVMVEHAVTGAEVSA